MKKLLITICLFLSLAVNSYAMIATAGQTITINGQIIEKTATELTFDGDNVILRFSDGTSQSADMETVSIVFDNSTTGIDQIHSFSFNGTVTGNLNISGIEPGQTIEVFDVSGKKVLSAKASNENINIDISNVKAGVYVLRAGNDMVKFIKR